MNNYGYFVICEPNQYFGQSVHRLIYEEAYGPIPKGYHIHHKDGNKLNNDLSNLEILTASEHIRLHKKGVKQKPETAIKRSISRGGECPYFRVSIQKSPLYAIGYGYVYQFYDEDNRHRRISATSIQRLKEKVEKAGLLWYKFSENNEEGE